MKERKKVKVFEVAYFSALGIYLFVTILDSSLFANYINFIYKPALVFSILLLLFSELSEKKITINEVKLFVICFFSTLLLIYHFNGYVYLPILFFVYSSRNVSFKKIAKFTIVETSLLLFIIILSSKIGLIKDYTYISENRIRHCLGFRYVLYPQMLLFNITTLIIYLNSRNNIILNIILILINYFMFLYTDARLSFYLSFLLIILCYIYKNRSKKCKKVFKPLYLMLTTSFVICCLLSLFLIFSYDSSNNLSIKMNDFLGDRLRLGKQSLLEYKINLFGHNVIYYGWGLDSNGNISTLSHSITYNYVDCLYLNICERYGILFLILFLMIFTYSCVESYKNKDYLALIILLFIALHGMIDDLEFNLYNNTWWLLVGTYLKNNIYRKKKV